MLDVGKKKDTSHPPRQRPFVIVGRGVIDYEFDKYCSMQVVSVEDAKSEIVKIFQEAWEKEHGFEWEDQGPPIQRYAEDILRS